MKQSGILWVMGCLFWFSCMACQDSHNSTSSPQIPVPEQQIPPVKVTTSPITSGHLVRRYRTYGQLEYVQKADLSFTASGLLGGIYMTNGQRVNKGDLLAVLDTSTWNYALELSELELKTAELRKNELLILYGGEAFRDDSVDSLALQAIALKSGYARAVLDYHHQVYLLQQRSLVAPFAGIIANCTARSGEVVSQGQVVAGLLYPGQLRARWQLLHAKTGNLSTGTRITIVSGVPGIDTLIANITSLNPQVNPHGLVELSALVANSPEVIVPDGLGVEIWLEELVPAQFMVPREAVITRAGQQIVFTLDEDNSRAKLEVIQVLDENETLLSVTGNFLTNDRVITSGHTFLTHDAKVIW